ncbi:MAG: O-acetylhomoserine aminocarboxypropyltransferase/cysteine synthase [Mailhella sp.]|nr:O-acetylhomoserine aminocarboxypropyltransferase/cysteine synthase [Mailhella sp.]
MAAITPETRASWHLETLQLHAGQELPDPATDARAVPIYQTTSYVFRDCAQAADRFALREGGNIYSRLTNTTQDVLEQRIAALEGGVGALAFASGAAALAAVFQNLCRCGDHIVSASTIYGGTFNYLRHTFRDAGVTTTFVHPDDPGAFEAAIRPETKLIFLESIGNPNANLIDIDAAAAIAHSHGIPLVVDNTFATPVLYRPIEHGADIVIHSATKFIGGHGTSLGGIVVDSGRFDWCAGGRFPRLSEPDPSYHGVCFARDCAPAGFITRLRAIILRDTGAAISPFNAFLLLQGTETLSLRVERHGANALAAAEFLASHPKVASVNHPGLPGNPYHALCMRDFPLGAGSIFTFDIRGGAEEARAFIDRLQLFSLLANVADVKSLVIHPASTTHAQCTPEELESQGIRPGTVRLSIGTEHIDDILRDLDQALA